MCPTTFVGADGNTKYERITQPIYDSASLATGGLSAVFFSAQLGSGASAWNATGTKTLEDTNMTVGGSLPAGYTFHLKALALQLDPGISVANLKAITKGGALSLRIASKDQLQLPIAVIPSASGIDGFATTATTDAGHTGVSDARNVFPIDQEIQILPNQNITCRIDWGTGPTLSVTQPIRLMFYGWVDRPVQ